MKKLISGLAFAAAFAAASQANAADIAPVYKAPPPVVVTYNWTGFYLGGSIGARWMDADWTTTCLQSTLAGVSCPNSAAFPGRLATDNPAGFSDTAWRASVYGGYNWQANAWVFGIEGDYGWAKNKETRLGIPGTWLTTVGGAPGSDFAQMEAGWDAGLRGRVGFLINPTVLVYATGGVQWQHVEVTAGCGTTAFAVGWCVPAGRLNSADTLSKTLTGWTIGGGVEAMVWTNWLARAEYRYADFGSFDTTLLTRGTTSGIDSINTTHKYTTQTVLVGLAYKFDYAKTPVVAKY